MGVLIYNKYRLILAPGIGFKEYKQLLGPMGSHQSEAESSSLTSIRCKINGTEAWVIMSAMLENPSIFIPSRSDAVMIFAAYHGTNDFIEDHDFKTELQPLLKPIYMKEFNAIREDIEQGQTCRLISFALTFNPKDAEFIILELKPESTYLDTRLLSQVGKLSGGGVNLHHLPYYMANDVKTMVTIGENYSSVGFPTKLDAATEMASVVSPIKVNENYGLCFGDAIKFKTNWSIRDAGAGVRAQEISRLKNPPLAGSGNSMVQKIAQARTPLINGIIYPRVVSMEDFIPMHSLAHATAFYTNLITEEIIYCINSNVSVLLQVPLFMNKFGRVINSPFKGFLPDPSKIIDGIRNLFKPITKPPINGEEFMVGFPITIEGLFYKGQIKATLDRYSTMSGTDPRWPPTIILQHMQTIIRELDDYCELLRRNGYLKEKLIAATQLRECLNIFFKD